MIDLKKYKTLKELQDYCRQLYNTNLLLQNKVNNLEAEAKHAKELLENVPTIATESDLEELLMREIGYIDKISKQGGLNEDEAKQLKIMVDSYVNLQRQKSGDKPKPKRKTTTDPAKLIALVKGNKE